MLARKTLFAAGSRRRPNRRREQSQISRTYLKNFSDPFDKETCELSMSEVLRLLYQWPPLLFHLLGVLAQQGKGDGLFVREVVVKRPDRRAAALRDRGHRGCFIANLDKQFRRRIQETGEPA